MINELLHQSLTNFYNKKDHMDQLNMILSNQKKVSLRLIDWFTTNYSKKYNIIYLIYSNDEGVNTLQSNTNKILHQFNVYNSYKLRLLCCVISGSKGYTILENDIGSIYSSFLIRLLYIFNIVFKNNTILLNSSNDLTSF